MNKLSSDEDYIIEVLIPRKMELKNVLKELEDIPKSYDLIKTGDLIQDLLVDENIAAMHKASNVMLVDYLKYNDHGQLHSIISMRNAINIYLITYETVVPNMVKNQGFSLDDATFTVSLSAFLHDVGNLVHRDYHYLSSLYLSKDIIWTYINKYYKGFSRDKKWLLFSHIANAVVSHDESVPAFTLEASSVKVGDGCDMSAGRSRRPYSIGKIDIHSVSALSITEVEIQRGKMKPLLIKINMTNPAGIFQVEGVLLEKLNTSILKNHTEIKVMVNGRPIKLSTLKK